MEQFNGNLWIKHHLAFLKGSYQLLKANNLDKGEEEQEEEAPVKRVKLKPYRSRGTQIKKRMKKNISRRQYIKLRKELQRKSAIIKSEAKAYAQ